MKFTNCYHYQSESFFQKLFDGFVKILARGSIVVSIVTIQHIIIFMLLWLYNSDSFVLQGIVFYGSTLSAAFYAFASRACRGYIRTSGERYYRLKVINNSITGFMSFLFVVLYLLVALYFGE